MKFLEALAERTLFFDGAMGTQLMEKGLTLQDIPETWNILKPDIIRGATWRAYHAALDL